jgi:hypothetical protein
MTYFFDSEVESMTYQAKVDKERTGDSNRNVHLALSAEPSGLRPRPQAFP